MYTENEEFGGINFECIYHEGNINEAQYKGKHLIGNFSYDKHQPHNPTGEYHIHLYQDNKQILSINKSGTAHDGYHGIRIPNRAYDALKNKFSDWEWPKSKIIESINEVYLLPEDYRERPVRVNAHQDFNLTNISAFNGFLLCFADDPFLTGGNGGWFARTVALVENQHGSIIKIRPDQFRFLDV